MGQSDSFNPPPPVGGMCSGPGRCSLLPCASVAAPIGTAAAMSRHLLRAVVPPCCPAVPLCRCPRVLKCRPLHCCALSLGATTSPAVALCAGCIVSRVCPCAMLPGLRTVCAAVASMPLHAVRLCAASLLPAARRVCGLYCALPGVLRVCTFFAACLALLFIVGISCV